MSGSRHAAASPLALVLLAASAAILPGEARGAEQAEVVARVNGEPVTRAEVERMRGSPLTLGQARRELGVEEPDADALERVALRNVIRRRLMIQEARRRGLTVPEKELDERIAALRRSFDDLGSFGAWMQEQGLDDRTLFESVRGDMSADRLWAALVEDVRVTDEEVRAYYDAHRDELRREEVRLRIIAVEDEAAVKEVVAALRKGADFGALARRRSRGLRAASGGDTGWVGSETLQAPVRDTVAVLNVGDTRGPLRRGSEFLVVRLEGRRRGATKTLAEARPEIELRLLPAERQEVVEAWLKRREAEARIDHLASARSPWTRR
jgi:parvulin-like peptidyl-prolyl isomerase